MNFTATTVPLRTENQVPQEEFSDERVCQPGELSLLAPESTYGLQPVVMKVGIERGHREKLMERLHLAMAIINSRVAASSLEPQFTIRELAGKIARGVFGDRLLGMVRRHLAGGGIVIWEGLPTSENFPDQATELSFGQSLVAVIAQGTTQSFGYREEDGGRLFQRLFPVAGVTNGGKTSAELLAHLDNPMLFIWAQPQVIHLVCVNNDAGAATIFLTMRAVLRGLREGYAERVIHLLQHPAYLTAISNSFVKDEGEKAVTTRARPVLYRQRGRGMPTHFLGKAYDMSVQPGIDGQEDYEHALEAYQTVLKERADLAISITARPGQAISFPQQKMLHGRRSIASTKYREMVRAYGRFDLFDLLCHLGHVPANYVFDAMNLVDR